MTTREKATNIYEAAVAAVHPKQLLKKYLSANENSIRIGNRQFNKNELGRLVVIAAGKAAGAMAFEAEQILGDAISYGLCITKHGHELPLSQLVIIEAGHPFPDKESTQAAVHIQQMVEGSDVNDIILLLLSGGASSLIADIPTGCTLADIKLLTELLVNSGASIKEINTVRKHTSTLKGGKLAGIASPAQLITLAISDVVDDDVSVIASGLTVPDTSTYAQAFAILQQYGLWQQIPASVKSHLQKGQEGVVPENPRTGDACFLQTQYYLIGNNAIALKAAQKAAENFGYQTSIYKAGLTEDVTTSSRLLIQQFKDYRGITPACILLGGEPTLKITGDGKGGRCQHFVLNALYEITRGGGSDMRNTLTILAAGTDGTDGPTDAAGAIADIDTIHTPAGNLLSVTQYLSEFNAYDFFDRAGGLIKTGATQTNAGDIIVLIVE
ncbi:glycerate kinase [soil metagenome]